MNYIEWAVIFICPISVLIEGDMMVDKWFIEHYIRRVKKRGAIQSKRKPRTGSYFWPGTTSDGNRIVRIPYKLDAGFFSKLFGKGSIDKITIRSFFRFVLPLLFLFVMMMMMMRMIMMTMMMMMTTTIMMMLVYALSRTKISHGEVDGILKLKTVGSGYEISMHDQEVWVRALPWAQFLQILREFYQNTLALPATKHTLRRFMLQKTLLAAFRLILLPYP